MPNVGQYLKGSWLKEFPQHKPSKDIIPLVNK